MLDMRKALYEVPEKKKVRVIIDTDCNCEADDQYAVAHTLMTPKFDVKGIIAEHYGNLFDKDSAEKSFQEVEKLMNLMGLSGKIKIFRGCPCKLDNEKIFIESEGSRFIIEEAMRDDARPLFVANQGALTNLASAYLMEPKIANKLTAIWIGGGIYPKGGWEFNLCNDINAANIIMDSQIELWQVPMNVYSMMKVSFAVLYEKVYTCGELGKYLIENMMRVNFRFNEFDFESIIGENQMSTAAKAAAYPSGESWQLGDSPVVGLMMTDHAGHYTMEGAPLFNTENGKYKLRPDNLQKIRVYNYVDSHFILDDFFAKLKYHFGE
jgi:purine nucleosidase